MSVISPDEVSPNTALVVDRLPEGMMAASVRSLLPVNFKTVVLQCTLEGKFTCVAAYRNNDKWYGNVTDMFMSYAHNLPEDTIWTEPLLNSSN